MSFEGTLAYSLCNLYSKPEVGFSSRCRAYLGHLKGNLIGGSIGARYLANP